MKFLIQFGLIQKKVTELVFFLSQNTIDGIDGK